MGLGTSSPIQHVIYGQATGKDGETVPALLLVFPSPEKGVGLFRWMASWVKDPKATIDDKWLDDIREDLRITFVIEPDAFYTLYFFESRTRPGVSRRYHVKRVPSRCDPEVLRATVPPPYMLGAMAPPGTDKSSPCSIPQTPLIWKYRLDIIERSRLPADSTEAWIDAHMAAGSVLAPTR